MRRLALLLVIAGCGGTSAAPARPDGDTPPPPSAVATCDAAAAHLATMPLPTDAQGDPVETARANCASQPWEQPLIDCVAASATWEVAGKCFPEDPLCAPLRQAIEASKDGQFLSLRGEPDYPDEPIEFESKLALLDGECLITVDDADEGVMSELQCLVVQSSDLATAEASYTALAQTIAGCLPEWTATPSDTAVSFVDPETYGNVALWAGTFTTGTGPVYYLRLDVYGMN